MKSAARMYIMGVLPFCMGMVIILANYVYLFNTVVRRRFQSQFPILGGLLAMFGMLLTCDMRFVKLCWLPILLDPAYLVYVWWLVYRVYAHFRHMKEECRISGNRMGYFKDGREVWSCALSDIRSLAYDGNRPMMRITLKSGRPDLWICHEIKGVGDAIRCLRQLPDPPSEGWCGNNTDRSGS